MKYFIFTPESQSTTTPLRAIKIEVPKSGCDTTNKIGRIKITIGNDKLFNSFILWIWCRW